MTGIVNIHVALAACTKQLAYQDAVPQATADGASETWKVRTLAATDTAGGGFAAEVLWVGTNGQQADTQWVEVGATDGWEGQNVTVFYSAHGIGQVFDEQMYTVPTPVVGTQYTFKVESYSSLPNSYIAWVEWGGTHHAGIYWTGHAPNTVDFSGGLESTCDTSRIDRTYVSSTMFRNKATQAYVSINNGTLVDQSSAGGIAWCTQPTKFRYYLHSAIDQTVCS
jgi:hypothetical protein